MRTVQATERGMLTVEEVARRLNISGDTVRRLIRSKKLKALNFGPRATRVQIEELERFIVACRIPDEVWDAVKGQA